VTAEHANIAQIRELAKTADAETLRECVNILCDRLELIDSTAAATKTTIENMQREIRRMSGALRGR
jgi:hypothetical protein